MTEIVVGARGLLAVLFCVGMFASAAQAQQRSILNTGFEEPDISTNFALLPQDDVPGWETTDDQDTIEIWSSGFQGIPSFEGGQFAELNAFSNGFLSQDICLTNGEVLSWSFAHHRRSRSGSESARFIIRSQDGSVLHQTLATQTSSNFNWNVNSGSQAYTGPTGIQKIGFVAVGGGGSGNLLDAVSIDLVSYAEINTASSSVMEGIDDNLPVVIVASGIVDTTTVIPINVNTALSTATQGVDYTLGAASITIPPGNYSGQPFSVNIPISSVYDNVTEGDETVVLELGTPSTSEIIFADLGCAGPPTTSITHTIRDSFTGLELTKAASQTSDVNANDTVTYTYTAKNTGSVTLNNVNITDVHSGNGSLSAITPASATLAANATQVFTATYLVTQEDINSGVDITNTATANATPQVGMLTAPTDDATVSVAAAAPDTTVTKSASPDSGLLPGQTVTYTYTVENTGNVDLTNVSMSDVHNGTGSLSAITPANVPALAPTETATFTATYVWTQADFDSGAPVTNTATSSATAARGTYAPESANESVASGTPTPAITFTKTASDTTNVAEGDAIIYTFTAENTGNVALTNVQVSDSHNGSGTLTAITPASVASLPVGQTATFTANYTVLQADIDAGGDITNTATVTADPVRGPPLPTTTANEAVTPAAPAPALSMVKTALDTAYAAIGDTIDYEYVVTNAGNVSVSAVSVTDDKITAPNSVSCPAGPIAPTEFVTCTATYTVDQNDLDAGSVTNNASATGTPTGGTLAPATANETVDGTQSPELRLTKTALDSDFVAVGDELDYSYLVENIGNVEITSIVVTDDMIASVDCPVTTIPAGGNVTCTATYTVEQDDLDVGFVTNLASVNGTPAGGTLAIDMDDATVNGTQSPELSIEKTALTTDFTAVGDTLSYEYEVTNTGNTTITAAISVDDDKITSPNSVSCPAIPSGGLLPTMAITCTATYAVTQADLDSGSVTNIASATDGTITSATDTATVSGTQSPALTLLKEPVETSFDAVGDILNYNYTVTNTGNVLIGSLSVTDDLIDTVTCNVPAIGNNDANLNPGEVVVCTAVYAVTQDDLNAGSVTNNASATGTPSGGTLTAPTDDATVSADQLPELTLVKTAGEASFDSVGDVLTYEYEVENTGNVLISALSVSDDKIASVTCDVAAVGNNDANLDPTETVICTASYTVTQDDLDAGAVTNNALATGTPAGGTLTDAPASETVNANQQPELETVKTATNVNFQLPGDVTTYEYVVTNTGNVTITAPISVTDNLITTVNCPALPTGGLVPTASLTCTASYTVTQADLDNGSVTNLASATDGTTTSPQTSETIPADQNPALSVTKAALFTDFTAAGEVVEYQYTVTNDGNLTLTGGINVVDDKIGTISCVTGNLIPTASQTCTANYTITQADMDAGSVTNQAFAQNGMLTSAPVDVTVTGTQTASLDFDKRGLSPDFDSVGDVLSYEFDVENTGNVTVTDVAITDNLVGTVSCPMTTLDPNQSMVCTATYTVDQDDIDAGSVTNNASVGGNSPAGPPTSTPDSVTTNSVPNPSVTFMKRAVTTSYAASGDVLSFAFDVENDGNVTVNNISISDSIIATVTCPLTTLAPTETMTCTANYTVDQDDVNDGSVTNTATLSADPADGSALPNETSSVIVDGSQDPELRVTKTANEADFDMPGDVLTYGYLIENIGNVSITGIVVSDDKIPSLSCTDTALEPGTSFTCTGSYTVDQDDIDNGSVTNIVSLTGTPAGGTLPPASDQATVGADIISGLTTVKTATTANYDSVGDAVDYTYQVTNTGNKTITDPISVADDKIATVSCPALPSGGLLPNASITCSGTYNVTQADIDAGSVTNIASATDGTAISPNATETVDAVQTPSIAMTKTGTPQVYTTLGETVSYTYVITNTGNVTINTALTVSDDRIASVNCPSVPVGGLAPNATLTCTGTDTVTQDDLDTGSITNTATSTDGAVTSPSIMETVTANQSPAINVVKNALTADFDMAGDIVEYEYLVTNAGNVTITSAISVSDDKIATINCPALPGGELAPTATLRCVGTYVVTQEDVDTGSVTNIASATDGTTTSPNATETVNAVQTPAISVVKSALTASFDTPGDVLAYDYQVRNTGNVTLTGNVMVSDDKIPTVTCPGLPMAGLAPNGSLTCSATYVVTQADIDAGFVTNVAFAQNGALTSPTDTATVNADQAPALTTVKTALTATYDMPGDTIDYEYLITNSGNTTITSAISVTDDKIIAPNSVTCPALPGGELAPAQSLTCTATYTVDQADIDSGSVVNIASSTDGTVMSPTDSVEVFATQDPAFTMVKNATVVNFNLPGDVSQYEYIVTNAGNTTIVNPITVDDNRIDTVFCPALPSGGLLPGDSITCNAGYEATQDDLDQGAVTNLATATDGFTTSPPASETIPAAQNPGLEIRKSSTDTTYAMVNDILTYDYEVENTGNITLTGDITVVDDKIGSFVCFTGNLTAVAPGNIQMCQRTYAVTQADIDAGEVTNNAYAEHPRGASDPVAVTIMGAQNPEITMVKASTTTDYANVGDTLEYTFDVTNTGNTTITFPITVNDNRIDDVMCPALPTGGLLPTNSLTCTGTDTVSQADIDAGAVTNTATATDGFTTSAPQMETVNAVQTPSLALTKIAEASDFDTLGDVLNYDFVVRNDGNVTITSAITVSDDRIGTINCPALPAGGLAPNQTLLCEASDTVDQVDLDLGSVTNTATATDGTITSPPEMVTITGTQSPALTTVKTPRETSFDAVGDTLTYDYLVTNTGNVTLTSAITVSDDKIVAPNAVTCPALPGGGLAPTASLTCEATYSVTQGDIDAGSVTNIASATDGTTTSPVVSATVNGAQTPAMSVTKTAASTDFAEVGDTLTYNYVVTNTGNVTLTSAISINDNRIPDVTCDALPSGGLVPTGTLSCTGTDTVTQEDLDAGSVTNTATATDGTTTSAPVDETVGGTQSPAITVDKVARSNDFNAIGDVLSYDFVIRNTGNVSQTDPATISDDKIGLINCPPYPGGELLPGGTHTCSATYAVTQVDLNAGEVINIASATIGGLTSAPDTATITGTQDPALGLTVTPDTPDYSTVGEQITYTYVVTNTGNVTITEAITINDNRNANVVCDALPADGLAPGETLNCTVVYTVTQADIDQGTIDNTATATDGTTTSAPDDASVTADITNGLAIEKRAITAGFNMPGDIVSYEYDVTNTGNATLTDLVSVSDNKIDDVTCPALPAGGLAPQAVLTCSADYAATQADIDAGSVTNIASADAGNTTSPTTEATVDAMSNPELSVTKAVAELVQVGGPIYDVTYQIVMRNTGNTTLSNLSLEDNLAAALTPAVIYDTPAVNISGFTGGSVNTDYDGASDVALLAGTPSLPVGDAGIVTIIVRIDTTEGGPVAGNTAIGNAAELAQAVPSNDPTVTPNTEDDINPTPLSVIDTDGDGAPDNFESATTDRDNDGIPDSEDYDPTGYFYCEESGAILSGGGILVSGPAGTNSTIGTANNIVIVQDGTQGFYQFYVTAPGRYTLAPTYPASGVASTDRPVQNVALDATSLLPNNPAVLGSSEVGSTGQLADFTAATNSPYYFTFDFEAGDPSILMNNIPLKNCGTPGIAVTKTSLADPLFLADGRQLVTYGFDVENTGQTLMEDVQVTDDLGSVFGAGRVEIQTLTLTDAPVNFASTANAAYDGELTTELLSGTGDLASGETLSLSLEAIVNPENDGEYVNTAGVSANEPLNGTPVTDEGTATVTIRPLSDASFLTVTKTAQPRTVQIGDPVLYNINVTNDSASTVTDINIVDRLPQGFAYVPGSGVVSDGTTELAVEPVVTSRGVISWPMDQTRAAPLDTLLAGETLSVSLRVLAGPNVTFGAHENEAYADSPLTGTRSASGTAIVDYIPEPSFDCTPVIGRVYDDVNHNGYPDDGEPGLPAVRLVTVNGDIITTDQYGRYHIPCAIIANGERGSNFLLKADTRTFPLGYKATTENPRVVRATRGKFVKMNFGAAHRPKLRVDLFAADFGDEFGMMMPSAARRVEALLAEAPNTERAILVYHADDLESVDFAQDRLGLALKVVRELAPKQFSDIALEASWGDADVFEKPDTEGEIAAGQLFDNDNDAPNRDRVAFFETQDGDIERGDFDRYDGDIEGPTHDETGDRFLGREAGLRGGAGSRGLSGDTRRESGVLGRRDKTEDETHRPGRLLRWIGWGDTTSTYSEALEIETTTDSLDPVKRLNAVADIVATEQGRMIMASGYWNYDAFIERAEIRFFDADRSVRGKPIAKANLSSGSVMIGVNDYMTPRMQYVLRVYGKDGSFDETAPKALRIGDPEFDLAPDDWAHQADAGFGQNTILTSKITVRGGSVRVYGRNVPGETVTVMGQTITVDPEGQFVTEQLLPGGTQSVEIEVAGVDDTTKRIVRTVDVKTRGTFFVGQIEATVGENIERDIDGNRSFEEGRIAFYVRSRLNDRWAVTATADTGEAEISDLLSGLDDKDLGQLLRRLDPDRYYPVYGDDSTIEQDAPTSGRIYARIERDDDYLLWGNYQTNFGDTEFGRVQRTLYGAKLHWDENGQPTKFGDDRTRLTGFIAEGGSRQGRDELRGTGGSVYYLRHGDISIGSEILRVETRDSVSGLVLESRRLNYGTDYDMDFIQGRIILNQPLGSTGSDGRLFRDGSQSGNDQTLVVDYEFTPVFGADDDAAVYGARGSRWFGDHIKLGATYNHDTDGGAESDLYGADLTFQLHAGTYVKGEIAKSQGQGVETFRSIDGGFTYNPSDRGGEAFANDDEAMAYSVEAAVDFSEVSEWKGTSYAYWRKRDAGFAGYAEATNQAIEQFGGGLDLVLNDITRFQARADVSDDKTLGTNSFVEATVEVKATEALSITGGVSYNDDARGNAGTSVGARAAYKFSEDDEVYIFGQVGLEGENTRTTDRIGLGAEVGISKNVIGGGEVSTGEDGLGVRASVRYKRDDGDEYYVAYDLPLNAQPTSNWGTFNLGARKRYGDALSVYGEERMQFNERGLNGVTHAYGVDYKPGNWNFGLSGEVGKVDQLDRQALSLSAGFADDRMKAGVTGEWREDENTLTGDTRKTWLLRAVTRYQASEELRLQGKFNMAVSDQDRNTGPQDFQLAEFTEASLAAAYRPIWDDRLNILAKYVFLEDLSPTSQRFGGQTLNYRQKSEIISVDSSFDVAARWTLGGKYAHRSGSVTSNRESLDFTKSMADLGVIRLDYHATSRWDATIEGRYLNIGDGAIKRTGGMAGVYRHLNDNAKLGVGFTWGGIEEQYLAAKEAEDLGWYINMIGKF